MADLGYLKEYVEEHNDKMKSLNLSQIPLIINAYGGPGCGKSTACLYLVSELKKLGFKAEYVQEYAKELVYEKRYDLLDGTMEHQIDILLEQNKRIDRLIGNVDFIVSDSPILLSYIYNKSHDQEFLKLIKELDSHYNTFSFFMDRDKNEFKTEGRIHNLDESINIDFEIEDLLRDCDIYYGTYTHETLYKILPNCIKTFSRINDLDNDFIIE